jgi:hypothetical protein
MVPARGRLVNTCASVCACSCSVIWSVSTAICSTRARNVASSHTADRRDTT